MATPRAYAGLSAQQRRDQRRERLIEAAIRVYGRVGWRNATVKMVCEEAGLTERYFYESFTNGEALLIASFDTVTQLVLNCLDGIRAEHEGSTETRCRAVLSAYFQMLKDDPDGARLFVVEIARVSPAVDEIMAHSLRSFGDLLARTVAPERQPQPTDAMLRVGAVGAVVQIAHSWIGSDFTESINSIAENAWHLVSVLAHERGAADSHDRPGIEI